MAHWTIQIAKTLKMKVLALGVLAITVTASVAEVGQQASLSACRPELRALCSGIEAGKGRKLACLIENRTKLGAECLAIVNTRSIAREAASRRELVSQAIAPKPLAQATGGQSDVRTPQERSSQAASGSANLEPTERKRVRGSMKACRLDIATFCSAVSAGAGGRMRCLIENRGKLSPECAGVLDERSNSRQTSRAACATDIQTLCEGARGAERHQCLDNNRQKLSPGCAAQLDKRALRNANTSPNSAPENDAKVQPTTPKQ